MTNWRTNLFGTLALLAAFITQYPDLLAAILEPGQAKLAAALAALVSGFFAFSNAKDRQVSGNGTFAAPTIVNDGSPHGTFPLILAAGLALGASACSSLDRYERSYGIQYEDAEGRHVGGTIRLAPRAGLAK
jgi:hypothetical protein